MPFGHLISMPVAPAPLPDLSTLDAAALRALVVAQQETLAEQQAKLLSRESEIEHLKLLILKLRRMQFGRKSERLDKQIAQLELQLEDLEATGSETAAAPSAEVKTAPVSSRKAPRRPLPEHLPRETRTIAPQQEACPDCGATLKHLGDVPPAISWTVDSP